MIPVPWRKSLIVCLRPNSGLGNRIRVVLGGKSLAHLEGRDFYYVWPTGKLFEPRMSDLWHFDSKQVSWTASRILAKRFRYADGDLEWLDDDKRREMLWQLRTVHALKLPAQARPWTEEFRTMRPVNAVASRVRAFYEAELAGSPYIGVQVRSHAVSHQKTRDASPVEWYIERMLEIRQQYPGIKFFISSDVDSTTRRVMNQIGNCSALYDKGPYNSLEGVRSAVVDLYLLASAQYIIGPYYSSFVELAEYLSGGRLKTETSKTARPTSISLLAPVRNPLIPAKRSGN